MSRRPRASEPPIADGVVSPALLTALVMLFVHLAAGAMLAAVAVTLSPGPDSPGGVWDALVWLLTLLLVAASARPVLRRTRRPLAVGALAGVLLAAVYLLIATALTESGAVTDLLGLRVVSLAAAGAGAGLWTARRPGAPVGADQAE